MRNNKLKVSLLAAILAATMIGCAETSSEKYTYTSSNEISHTPTTETTFTSQPEDIEQATPSEQTDLNGGGITLAEIPTYSGDTYTVINDNVPFFTQDDLSKAVTSWEEYGNLDGLGRCTSCWASVGQDIMPTGERGSIGSVKPTGWHTVKYDIVDGKYLYNRSHLIGWQLTGENANEKNLVTGTRYFNVEGMLPFENMVADYVHEDGGHVLYRVTPMFDGNDLVCKGVLMEAISVEDNGDSILFNVFVYNVQPGVRIDYATGESSLENNSTVDEQVSETQNQTATTKNDTYVVNIKTKKFHKEDCSAVSSMSETNKQVVETSRDELISEGYSPCGICKP